MRRYLFWMILAAAIFSRPVLAQDEVKPLLTIPHEWPIGASRWHPNGHDFWTTNREFSPLADGQYDYQDRLRLWNGDTGSLIRELLYRGDNIQMYLDWSAGENRVLVYGGNSLEIWDALNGEKTATLDYSTWISGAHWNTDFSRVLFWSYNDGSIHVWDSVTGQNSLKIDSGRTSELVDAAWSRDESAILSVLTQMPGRVDIWDSTSGERKLSFEYPSMVYRADWNSDGSRILIQGDKIIQLIDLATGAVLLEKRDDEYLYRADWSPNRNLIAVRVENQSHVEIWDSHSGTVLASVTHADNEENRIFEVLWSKDYRRLLTHSAGEISLWDATAGDNLLHITVDPRSFNMSWLSWSPDERKLVYMRSDSSMAVVTLADNQSVELELPQPIQLSMPAPTFVWNNDSSQVMLWWVDNVARVWDTANGKLLAALTHPIPQGFQSMLVTGAIWSPDERLILTRATPDYCGGLASCPSVASVWPAP
jgi:WD40 repeat protein